MKRKELGQLSSGLNMVHHNVQRRTLCWSKVATAFFSHLCDDGQADEPKKHSQANLSFPHQLAVNPNQNDFEVALNATPKSGLNQVVPQRSDTPPQIGKLILMHVIDAENLKFSALQYRRHRAIQHNHHCSLIFSGSQRHQHMGHFVTAYAVVEPEVVMGANSQTYSDAFTDYFYSPNYWPK